MTNKLEKIRDVIDTALEKAGLDPTRALKFGCKVKVYADNGKPYGAGASYDFMDGILVGENERFFNIKYGGMEGSFPKDSTGMKSRIDEIIGRELHLEDVLLAIRKHIIDFFKKASAINHLMFSGDWQLGKPLHEQSPETIEFIFNLLCEHEKRR